MRKGARLAQNGHEVGVAVPTRDNVGMQMRDAATGSGTEIEPDIEAVGIERGREEFFCDNDLGHQAGEFRRRELFKLSHLAKRDGEKMARVVRKTIEDEVSFRGAMNDQSSPIISQLREFGKWPLHPGRIAWRFNVFHAPVSVKLLHV